MKTLKSINRIASAKPISMGGISMMQPLPLDGIDQIDPFLLIQHGLVEVEPGADHRHEGVGPHPHRGFSPVTFVFQGSVHHRDSLYHSEVVSDGGTQWMHAGRGITHSERPGQEFAEKGGTHEIIQFWVNSPARHKMDTPFYQPISKAETPTLIKQQTEIAVVAGELEGIKGPAKTLTPQTLLRTTSPKGSEFSINIPEHYNCLIYLLDGQLTVNGQQAVAEQLVWFNNEGESIEIAAIKDTRAILLSGEPIGEPVASYGPFVMNSQSEIMEALRDSQQGKMGILIEDF